ncbi:MAG: MotA/TolQ/ExbB proton channel family protein [Victivallaceae bacterium]
MILNFCPVFAAAGAYYAFEQSDLPGKTIVVLLFFGSILTWTIMLEKGMSLFRAKKASELFIKLFRERTSTVALFREAQRDPSPIAKIYVSAVEKLLDFYSISPEQTSIPGISANQNKKLTTAQIEALRTVLEREVSDQILVLEERIGLLATAVSVSPFFGLFGTVWGIMIAFCGLASQGRAEISALAPGVSGALLTTVVGLLVAIPSLIGYNLLTLNIRKITVYMDNFAEEFIARIKLEQLDAEEQG